MRKRFDVAVIPKEQKIKVPEVGTVFQSYGYVHIVVAEGLTTPNDSGMITVASHNDYIFTFNCTVGEFGVFCLKEYWGENEEEILGQLDKIDLYVK